MFYKILLLLTVFSASLGVPLNTSLVNLQTFMKSIDTEIDLFTSNVLWVFTEQQIATRGMINEAKQTFLQNLNDTAPLYFSYIETAKEEAEVIGLNITSCIDLGDNELYTLNSTYTTTIFSEIDAFDSNVSTILTEYFISAYLDPLQQRISMKLKVDKCLDDACAPLLISELTEEYSETSAQMISSFGSALQSFVLDYPVRLSQFVDSANFTVNVNNVIENVTNCIGNL